MTKITELPQTTTMAAGDLLAVVTNPGTTPVTNKMSFDDFNVAIQNRTILTSQLISQTAAAAYQLTVSVYYTDGALNTATVVWPDGSAGAYATTNHNTTWAAVDAYTVTHTTSGRTVTQPVVTRDGSGRIITKPVLVVT